MFKVLKLANKKQINTNEENPEKSEQSRNRKWRNVVL